MITTRDITLEDLRVRARLSMAPHAIRRMWQRHITEREVLLTAIAPQWIEQNSPGHPVDRSVYCNGRIRVVIAHATRTIITIEIEGLHDYDPDGYMRAAPPLGPERCLRANAADDNDALAA